MVELGLTRIQGKIWKAKLGIYARFKQGKALVNIAFQMTTELVECDEGLGEQEGLRGDVNNIMILNLSMFWNKT